MPVTRKTIEYASNTTHLLDGFKRDFTPLFGDVDLRDINLDGIHKVTGFDEIDRDAIVSFLKQIQLEQPTPVSAPPSNMSAASAQSAPVSVASNAISPHEIAPNSSAASAQSAPVSAASASPVDTASNSSAAPASNSSAADVIEICLGNNLESSSGCDHIGHNCEYPWNPCFEPCYSIRKTRKITISVESNVIIVTIRTDTDKFCECSLAPESFKEQFYALCDPDKMKCYESILAPMMDHSSYPMLYVTITGTDGVKTRINDKEKGYNLLSRILPEYEKVAKKTLKEEDFMASLVASLF
jgi:hypothetical protein